LRYADFERMISEMARRVPAEFLDGIESIEVTRKTVPHPLRRDVYTLGECVPQLVPGEGPAQLRSVVLLHYGSFAALSRIAADFDWRHEARETLTHELRHHIEWRASVPDLEALDEAAEANYARHDGEPFDPLFYLDGEKIGEGVTRVDDDVFFDRILSGPVERVTWHGREWEVRLPEEPADVNFLRLEGLEPEPAGEVLLVVRKKPGAANLWRRATVAATSAAATAVQPGSER